MAEPAAPRSAATILLLRDGTTGLEVLVLEKAAGEHFAGGALVFPGGKIDAEDKAFTGPIGEPYHPLSTHKIAALRELFEECGILLARQTGTERLMSFDDVARWRVSAPALPFHAGITASSLELATDQMVHFAHWITPVDRPVRFDAHFFIAAVPPEQMVAVVDGHEIVDANWRRPTDILDEAATGAFKLVLPTMMNLTKLGKRASVDEALSLARESKVVCVTPLWLETEQGPRACIPAEADYGITVIPLDLVRQA